ncbi:MAG: nucleotidyltransferase family protein [Planctomycetes bacterium]|nr:nucleotidyltransferase family protein [Planctomycetota bacterium]
MRIFALIPAAGKSVRMGTPKLSLPLGERAVLERVLDAMRPLQLSEILVVLGPHGEDLALIAKGAGASVLSLSDETADMRATVLHGLAWLEERHAPEPDDALLLCPADHPLLDGGVVSSLLEATRAKRGSIWIPTFEGRRGHPALVSWRHVCGIRAMAANLGLNSYFRFCAEETVEVPYPSPEILLDLDTPEDYARLRERFSVR